MRRFLRLTMTFGAALTLVLTGCSGGNGGSDEDADASGMDFSDYAKSRQTMTENGAYFVTYAPDPDPIPVSELFKVKVDVYKSQDMKEMVSDADLQIEARMPTHGHGMNTDPTVEKKDGGYMIDGMKFHMPSDPDNPWVMEIEVDKGGAADMAKFQVITKK